MNQQPIEKRVSVPEEHLDVHSIFYTLQGEGPFAGTPCVFVRLAGCNLQCRMCDTDYTSGRRMMSVGDILKKILEVAYDNTGDTYWPGLVVVTGGEPFRQPLGYFLKTLVRRGLWIQVESNGTLHAPMEIEYNLNISQRKGVYIVCSPKTPIISEHIRANACCFKYVLNHTEIHESDGLPTRVLGNPTGAIVARPRAGALVYLQPADNGMSDPNNPHSPNLQAVKKSCLKHGYILNLQLHKILGVE